MISGRKPWTCTHVLRQIIISAQILVCRRRGWGGTATRSGVLRLTTGRWINKTKSPIGVALGRVHLMPRIHRAIEGEAAIFVPGAATHSFKRRKLSVVCSAAGDIDADRHTAARIVHWDSTGCRVMAGAVAVALQIWPISLAGTANDQVFGQWVVSSARAPRTAASRCVESRAIVSATTTHMQISQRVELNPMGSSHPWQRLAIVNCTYHS